MALEEAEEYRIYGDLCIGNVGDFDSTELEDPGYKIVVRRGKSLLQDLNPMFMQMPLPF